MPFFVHLVPQRIGLILLAGCLVGCAQEGHGETLPEGEGVTSFQDADSPDEVIEAAADGQAGAPGDKHESEPSPSAPANLDHPSDPEEWVPISEWEGEQVTTVRSFFDSGSLEQIRTTLLGVEGPDGFHGPEMVYHPNGILKRVRTWRHGRPEGAYRVWFRTGNVKHQGVFRNGEQHGEFLRYRNEVDDLLLRANYNDGKLHGEVTEYFVGGEPRDIAQWKFGKRHGVHQVWVKADKQVIDEVYQDDQLHGPYRTFYPATGKLRVSGAYELGKKSGLWESWDEQGQLSLRENYVQDLQHGLREAFLNGQVVERGHFVNGVEHGERSEFYGDGAKRAAGLVENGRRVGPWFYWNPDGTLIEALSGTYVNDRLSEEK